MNNLQDNSYQCHADAAGSSMHDQYSWLIASLLLVEYCIVRCDFRLIVVQGSTTLRRRPSPKSAINMKITLYRKSGCPWSAAVMGFLNELNIPFEIKNVTTNPAYLKEVEAASGQSKSPTLNIDGTILPDANVEDVAKVLEERGIVF
jgi:glutaredoxin